MQGSKINSILTIEYMCNEKENQFFDRKSAKKDVKELANHIAGFANASGGTLVIGIADDGKIEGFEDCKDKYNKFLKIISGDYLKTVPKFENETLEVINDKGNNEILLKDNNINQKWKNLNIIEQKTIQFIFDKGDVMTHQIAEYIERDRKTAQRILKKLETEGLIEWVGTSNKDPKKIYRIK